jgi:hypothetical protein
MHLPVMCESMERNCRILSHAEAISCGFAVACSFLAAANAASCVGGSGTTVSPNAVVFFIKRYAYDLRKLLHRQHLHPDIRKIVFPVPLRVCFTRVAPAAAAASSFSRTPPTGRTSPKW